MPTEIRDMIQPHPESKPIHKLRGIIVYPSHCQCGDWSLPQGLDAHYVIGNGWEKWEEGYHQNRDGRIWQVRDEKVQGNYWISNGLITCTLGICLVGVPRFIPPHGALVAAPKYHQWDGKGAWATERQIQSLILLIANICKRNVLGPLCTYYPPFDTQDTKSLWVVEGRRIQPGVKWSETGLRLEIIRAEAAASIAIS